MTGQLLLRPMSLDDVDAVVTLDDRAFGASSWSRRHFIGELTESPISILYVLVDDRQQTEQRILGYFGTWLVVDELHLCTFAIDPDHHRRGLGRLLLNCVIRLAQRLECETIQLEVRESNDAARSLYRSRGFVDQTIRRNLYSNPREDGVLMNMLTPTHIDQAGGKPSSAHWTGGLRLHWDDRGGAIEEHWPGR